MLKNLGENENRMTEIRKFTEKFHMLKSKLERKYPQIFAEGSVLKEESNNLVDIKPETSSQEMCPPPLTQNSDNH